MPDKDRSRASDEAEWRKLCREDPDISERAIVLQVLRDDNAERWTRAELEREIYDIDSETLTAAMERLRQEGVVHLSGDLVWASRCARRLDALGMVSI
jgi:hypothetical protein